MPDPEQLLDALRRAGVERRIVAAMRAAPRELFVPDAGRSLAYADEALPIGRGQTISQPSAVAWMCAALEVAPGDRVLDVGTGSGWHAAVLANLGARVVSVERDPVLTAMAAAALAAAGVAGVELVVGDGMRGHPPGAPYDAINVAAAAARPEDLAVLEGQLAAGGRLVAPVGGDDGWQQLVRVRRAGPDLVREVLGPVRFVPLLPGVVDAD